MYRQCRTPCLSIINKYFCTAFDLILEMADDLSFSVAVMYEQTNLRIGSFLCFLPWLQVLPD